MAVRKSAMRTIYHVKDGPQSMYEIDAGHALKFKNEWSATPWEQDGKPAAAVVEILPGWEDGTARERIDLAMSLGAPRKGLTAAHADEVITAEVERRLETPEPVLGPEANQRRGQVTIPNDWQNLNSTDRINLAASLGASRSGLTPAGADRAIQGEFDRRASSPRQGNPNARLEDRNEAEAGTTYADADLRRSDADRLRMDETAAQVRRAEADRQRSATRPLNEAERRGE